MMFDCPTNTLQHHPSLVEYKALGEGDLWYLLDCISGALSFMQEKKVRCPNISPADIYMVRTPFQKMVYKLSDRFFKTFETGGFYDLVANLDDKDVIKEIKRTVIMAPL
jgi:hypothetical protein